MFFFNNFKVPKLGVMLVGWGGNNGSTLTACCLANRHNMTWRHKEGVGKSNYFGSITQSSTVLMGTSSVDGSDVFVPFKNVLPMCDPSQIIFDGKLATIHIFFFVILPGTL